MNADSTGSVCLASLERDLCKLVRKYLRYSNVVGTALLFEVSYLPPVECEGDVSGRVRGRHGAGGAQTRTHSVPGSVRHQFWAPLWRLCNKDMRNSKNDYD